MKRSFLLIALSILALSLVGCSKKSINSAPTSIGSAPGASAPSTGNSSGATQQAANVPKFAATNVVNDVRPAVVKVDVSGQAQNPGPFGIGSGGGTTQAAGTGTGMLLDMQGNILTNNHVVTLEGNSPASSIKVTLANGKTTDAKIVGQDDQTDLAVIRVSTDSLSGTKAVKFPDPNSTVVGEPVVAIGYALDLGGEPTVTEGVVSATNREIDETNATISGAVQTDAAINPGNSGGPLVDLNGLVVGVSTAGLRGTPQEPVQGVNFAISDATAQPVMQQLMAHGKVTRGYMGVLVTNITPALAQSDNLPIDHGAGVGDVTQGSPADQAGLQPGDIIVQVGNVPIQNTGDLTTALTTNGPGSKVTVTYYRGKDKHTTDITLGTRPSGS